MPNVLSKLLFATKGRPRLSAALVLAIFSALGVILKQVRDRRAEHAEGRILHRRNSGILQKDGSKVIFVPYNGGTSKVYVQPTRNVVFDAHRRHFLDKRGHAAAPLEGRVGVNRRFARQLDSIWAIIVPRFYCKESGLLFLHFTFLMVRTYLSLLVARLDGALVRDLVAANGPGFARGIALWFLLAVPASYTNGMIRFLQSKTSISFRTRLTRYVHDLYLNDKLPYYRVMTDGEIDGIDQFITTDITKFCDTAASLFSNLGKPTIDLFVFNYQLYRSLGPLSLVLMLSNFVGTAYMIKKASPSFGRLAAGEARLEADFRGAHSRLITNAEEIAFYNGSEKERSILEKTYQKLMRHVNGVLKLRIAYNWFEDYIIKYGWSSVGLLCMSFPIFFPNLGGIDGDSKFEHSALATDDRQRERTRGFITNKRLMLSLAEAGGRMMYSYKDLAELAGHTSRVYALLSTLHRVHANAYFAGRNELQPEPFSLADVQGTVQEGYDGIRLEGVPVVAPATHNQSGEVLIAQLDLIVKRGEHVLISGPNGVGKTAVARVIAGLWPVFRGLVSKPKPDDIFYIPQRPYLSSGTLRDQIIYPHSHADMVNGGRRDRELLEILHLVKLAYLPKREGGWETTKEWKDVFSGGEKQRVCLARMFYHAPRYAILDEASSAISSDVEGDIYQRAKDAGITLVTISHRPTLLKYHTFQLKLGTGNDLLGWQLERIGTETERLTVEHEIMRLEKDLSEVEALKSRREEIERYLNMQTLEDGSSHITCDGG